jgi:hypothetical protein
MTATMGRTLHARRAMALAATLICLLVVMLLASSVIKALTMRRQASRWDEQQLQCLFLIESAVDRSKARLAQDPDFAGESWTASMSERGETRSGIAEIRVERVPHESQLRRVEIIARWPDDPLMRVQRTKQLTITLASSGDSL